ncbi:MAG: hypothetical protein GY906_27695 [bacterium]|nr:hypothetical protein [bacterium]
MAISTQRWWATGVTIILSSFVGVANATAQETRHNVLTSVQSATNLGTTSVRDRDLLSVRLDGASFAVLPALGDLLPDGVDVDALSALADGTLVFSTSVSYKVGGVEAHDEDLVAFQDGVLSLVFDGSASGLPVKADIDAVHVVSLAPLRFYYSLDAPTTVAGIVIADDDIVEHNSGVHTVVLSGADLLGDQAARADVDALWVDADGLEYAVSLDVSIEDSTNRDEADDEDILLKAGQSLLRIFDGSAAGLDVPGLDLDAIHVELALFADGFESGNTSQWSSTKP